MPENLEYIVDKAVCYCDKGAKPDYFRGTHNTNVKISSCRVCIASDKIPIENIPSFGACSVGGTCTPAPLDWQKTYQVRVKGQQTILYESFLPCSKGGKITFMTSGQIPVSESDLEELMEEHGEEEEGLSWWDAAEMIPFAGGVIGMVRSGAKGDWLGFGLSLGSLALDVGGLFSFGAGNAASAAVKGGKLARVGAKAMKAGSKGMKALKAGGKAAAVALAKKVDDIALKTGKVCVFACFPEGTPVWTEDGLRPIESIEPGDRVWSWNEQTGVNDLQEVISTMEKEIDATVYIELEGETIETTAEHPFFTKNGWKDASEINTADYIQTKDSGFKPVLNHSFAYKSKKVFNLEVGNWHTYFVGVLAWLVHNARPCISKMIKNPEWLRNLKKGNYFNFIREQFYTRMGGFNEIVLATGKRLDSYIPGKEIISRKFTQLSRVSQQTAKKYIDEMVSKYPPGTKIKPTARNADAINQGGKTLKGDLILEVPVQKGGVPQSVLNHAKTRRVTIRDINGTIYK